MNIILNSQLTPLPSNIITLKDLMDWKKIPSDATAIAINGKIAKLHEADSIKLHQDDNLMIITAAFGG